MIERLSNYSDCLPILRTETVFFSVASTRFKLGPVDCQAGMIALSLVSLWGCPLNMGEVGLKTSLRGAKPMSVFTTSASYFVFYEAKLRKDNFGQLQLAEAEAKA